MKSRYSYNKSITGKNIGLTAGKESFKGNMNLTSDRQRMLAGSMIERLSGGSKKILGGRRNTQLPGMKMNDIQKIEESKGDQSLFLNQI